MHTRIHTLAAAFACSLGLLAASAQAADSPAPAKSAAATAPAPAKTSQQNRMKDCHAEAKTKALKGAERKAFMSECLKAK